MPALFLPPEFAYQSIPDTELSYTFLPRWHPVDVQTWLHLLKTFYRVWIPQPRIKLVHTMVQKTRKHWSIRNVFPYLFSLSNTSTELQHGTQLLAKKLTFASLAMFDIQYLMSERHDKSAISPSGLKHVLKQGMANLGVSVNWKWDRQVTYWLAALCC